MFEPSESLIHLKSLCKQLQRALAPANHEDVALIEDLAVCISSVAEDLEEWATRKGRTIN